MKFTLRHKNVLQRIETHTYYTGEARKAAGMPLMAAAHIEACGDDKIQLTDHITTACSEISRLLSTYLAICHSHTIDDNNNNDSITLFRLNAPTNFPIECVADIEQAIENYIVSRVMHLWIAQHKPDESVIYANEVQQQTALLRELAVMRKRPKRKCATEEKTIDI